MSMIYSQLRSMQYTRKGAAVCTVDISTAVCVAVLPIASYCLQTNTAAADTCPPPRLMRTLPQALVTAAEFENAEGGSR